MPLYIGKGVAACMVSKLTGGADARPTCVTQGATDGSGRYSTVVLTLKDAQTGAADFLGKA